MLFYVGVAAAVSLERNRRSQTLRLRPGKQHDLNSLGATTMPGCARRKLLCKDRVQVVHCYTRCVRRAFLAGTDPLTGKDFNYRRDWIRSWLEQQAALFGIETGFHVQRGNHL